MANVDPRYHAKELAIGLTLNGRARAYPFAELSRHRTPFVDQFAGQDITVEFDAQNRTGRVLGDDGAPMGSLIVFEVDDITAAREIASGDPYVTEGIFERWELHETRVVFP